VALVVEMVAMAQAHFLVRMEQPTKVLRAVPTSVAQTLTRCPLVVVVLEALVLMTLVEALELVELE
jgi:hypothetical protein